MSDNQKSTYDTLFELALNKANTAAKLASLEKTLKREKKGGFVGRADARRKTAQIRAKKAHTQKL